MRWLRYRRCSGAPGSGTIGIANRFGGGGGDAARGVDDRQRYATAFQRQQPLLDLAAIVNRFDDGLGSAPARLPVRKRALRIGLDQANRMAGLHRRKCKADGKRTLAAATLLGSQYQRKH